MKELYGGAKIKKNIGILLLISILIVTSISFGGVAYADSGTDGSESEVTFAGGSGTETDPYIIETAEQLDAVRNNLRASYRLNADIEFTEADFAEGGKFYNEGKGWIPINNFSGTFDGNGHVIRNIVINGSTSYTGFFGSCGSNAKIMNMGIENGKIKGDYYVGGIVGGSHNCIIEKCYYAGTVNGNSYIGGIVGWCEKGSIVKNCYNTASLTDNSDLKGGIVGWLGEGEISNCYNVGNINKNNGSGEIAGINNKGSITNCYYIEAQLPGVGSGTDTAIACSMNDFSLQSTFAGFDFDTVWAINENGEYRFPILRGMPNDVTFGRTENFTDFAGGYGIKSSPYIITNTQQLNNVRNYLYASFRLANDIEFTASDTAWGSIGTSSNPFTGIFDGGGYVIKGLHCYAGLFGYNEGTIIRLGMIDGIIRDISSRGNAGSICGTNKGLVSKCYNTCTVTAGRAGGIVGYNYGTIENCYNSGVINVGGYGYDRYAGGIAGYNVKSDKYIGKIVNCYNIGRIDRTNTNYNKFDYKGSIAGSNYNDAVVTGCYYSNIGIKACGNADDNTGMASVTELRNPETYEGFDFENIWTINPEAVYWLPTLRDVTNYAVAPAENTTDFAGGYGTCDSPYLIKTTQQLDNIRKDLYAFYRLENDIVFEKKDFSKTGNFYNEGKRWEPIGSRENPFDGSLDGNGHCIKGLIIDRPDERYCGLFSYTYGEIKNLKISNFNVIGGAGQACLTAYNYGIIDGCYNINPVKFIKNPENNYSCDSGIFSYYNYGTIMNCYNLGDIESCNSVGAMAYMNSGVIKQCYNAGNIISDDYSAAGIAITNSGRVCDSYNTGDIEADGFTGGIVADINAESSSDPIMNCYNTGTIKTRTNSWFEEADMMYLAGGIIGNNYKGTKVTNCYYLDSNSEYDENLEYGSVCSLSKMERKSTYNGFDFENIWEFDESGDYKFPVLRGVNNYATAPVENTTEFAGGYGTKSKPYIIESKTQLNNVRNKLNKCYKLNADLNLSAADFAEGGMFYNDGKGWEPIGNSENMFIGTFDGNGHTISGLQITRNDEENIGLFGYSCGVVKNLKMVDTIVEGKTNAGSIVGYNSTGKVIKCDTRGTVKAYRDEEHNDDDEVYAGGIAGYSDEGSIKECSNGATVEVGCYEGWAYAGGIAGFIGAQWGSEHAEITGCNNYGKIKDLKSGESAWGICIGGIVGENHGKVTLCYNTGTVSGTETEDTASAGIAGSNFHGSITGSYNLGNVSSKWCAGGILAKVRESSDVSDCYNAGRIATVSTSEYQVCGGIIGDSGSYGLDKLERCYNLGVISSKNGAAGGIAGSIGTKDLTVTTCYNIGEVSCSSGDAGGIAGKSEATISDCFYLDNISKGVGSGTDAATKCSSADMQNEETYGDAFDFDYDMIWAISGTAEYKYPVLTEVVNPEFQYTLSLEAKQGVPEVPAAVSYGNGKITVKAAAGQKYVCVADSEAGESGIIPALSSLDWKSASGSMLTFEGLEQGRTYRIYTYIPAAGGKSASYASQPLVVTLKEVGDLSGDGKIDSSDAFYLRRAFAGWDGYELNFSAADINADGKLSADDIMILERYIAGWSSYKTLPVRK